jgi:hypothetical protein
MLEEALLPEKGRQVRCIACQHIWQQMSDRTLHTNNDHPFIGGADVALQMAVSSERQPSWVGWIAFLAVLFSCMSALIFGRNIIVAHWSGAERYFRLVGLQTTPPESLLSIANASSQIHRDGSIDMIRIMGNVLNTSDRVCSIPPLKIKLIGDPSHPKCLEKGKEDGCILDHWDHRLSEQSLLPGEKIHFETNPRPKIEGTQHIRVEF